MPTSNARTASSRASTIPTSPTTKPPPRTKFKEINEAYEVLSDPQKRANYDRFGQAGAKARATAVRKAEGFGDIFDMFFGSARRRRRSPRAARRVAAICATTSRSRSKRRSRAQREISFRHLGACATCKGSGAEPGTLVVRCDRCGGNGRQRSGAPNAARPVRHADDLYEVRRRRSGRAARRARTAAAAAGSNTPARCPSRFRPASTTAAASASRARRSGRARRGAGRPLRLSERVASPALRTATGKTCTSTCR